MDCEHGWGECHACTPGVVDYTRTGDREHPVERTIHLDADTNECLSCGDTWGDCEYDQGVEGCDGGAEACVMCGQTMRCAL